MTVIWNPLAVGVPDVSGNHFRNYFPGLKYVDAYANNYYNKSGVYAFHRTEGSTGPTPASRSCSRSGA
jgi:hypothetical protein